MKRKVEIDWFRRVVDILSERFPGLRLGVQEQHPHVDALLEIPKQPGLNFDVNINLQNLDELHLSVGGFWVEWFPCGDPKVFEDFIDATTGFISGAYRIIEYRVGSILTSAVLQKPMNGSWVTINGRGTLGALIPWPRQQCVLQNNTWPNKSFHRTFA